VGPPSHWQKKECEKVGEIVRQINGDLLLPTDRIRLRYCLDELKTMEDLSVRSVMHDGRCQVRVNRTSVNCESNHT
jgi:hypothetical protein